MAINDVFNSLEFDGVNSLGNGVFITGEAVYDAPERDVEMIEIPGRNGDFQLDNGRWKNIDVTYKAGVFGGDQNEFATKIRSYRNLLASRIGYKRLTDTYNPDEYRLGTFVNAFEAKTASRKRAGEFDLVFNCKPQRWLTSGEQEITVTDGDIVTNPTPYDASPLLIVEGYGTIDFNGYEIELDDEIVGDVEIPAGWSASAPYDISFPQVYISPGDDISINGAYINLSFKRKTSPGDYSFITANSSIVSWSGDASEQPTIASAGNSAGGVQIKFTTPFQADYGTLNLRSVTCKARLCFRRNGNDYYSEVTITALLRYGDPDYDTVRIDYSLSSMANTIELNSVACGSQGGIIHSTATSYGHPTIIDCDLGEAYTENNGNVSSLNAYIDLGSDLPVLAPGANTFTFDNTITSLKVIPRWFIL